MNFHSVVCSSRVVVVIILITYNITSLLLLSLQGTGYSILYLYLYYYYYYSTTTNNRVKIHSFLTSKKLLRTQESESASIEPSNICMC